MEKFILEKASAGINWCTEYLLFGLGFTMALLVAMQVFCRYVLNHSLFWSEELARFILVWLTFLGASSAYYRKVNPGVDFLYEKLPPFFKKCSTIMTHIVSLGFFIVMIVYGCKFAWFVRLQISPALQMPKWIILSIIPVTGIIMMIHSLTFLFADFKRDHHDH